MLSCCLALWMLSFYHYQSMSGVTCYSVSVTHSDVNAMMRSMMQLQRPLCTVTASRPHSQIDSSLSAKKRNKHTDSSSSSSKQSAPPATAAAAAAAPLHSIREQAPQRITNQLNIPVRQQIAWAKAKKRLDKQQVSASIVIGKVKKGGYRRDKRDDALSNNSTTRRSSDESMEDFDALDYMNMKPPAIFVDGYNIIGVMKSSSYGTTDTSYSSYPIDFEAARDSLISDLCMLRSATGWWIELVFDAYKSGNPQSSSSATDNIIVTYTSATDTADTFIERRFQELSNEGFTNMVVATDDNVLRMVAGSNGAGYISATMLLDELRIAYRGWDTVATQLDVEARRHKPTIASSVTDEFRAVMEQMKRQQARSSSGSNAAVSSTVHPSSSSAPATIITISSDNATIYTNHSRVADTDSGALSTVTSTNNHQASSSSAKPASSASSSSAAVPSSSIVSAGTVIIQRRLDGTTPIASASASGSSGSGSGFLSMVDEIEDEINSEYGYTVGGGGSRVDVRSKPTKCVDPSLSSSSSSSSSNKSHHASSSSKVPPPPPKPNSKAPPPKPNSNTASPGTRGGGGRGGGGVFKPTVGLGASAELRRAYELLLKQQQLKDGS